MKKIIEALKEAQSVTYTTKFTILKRERLRFMIDEALKEVTEISSNGMLAVTSDSKENNKESEVALPKKRRCVCHNDSGKELDQNGNCKWCGGSFFYGNDR